MNATQVSLTRWCAPASCAATSTSARLIRCALSTTASASTCGQTTRGAMAWSTALSETGVPTRGLAVSLRGVTKTYDNGVMALGPLDLDVPRGEFVSLLGPSGCGKSTALRLIAGLAAPTTGSVDVSIRPGDKRASPSIGFVFQEPTLMPWASVRENVRLPLRIAHMPTEAANARVDAAL